MANRLTPDQSEYSDVQDIIEFANSRRGEQAMKRVAGHELPDELGGLIDRYVSMRASRDPFIWKWVHRLAPHFTFPFVRSDHENELRNVKTIATLFLTLLDDVLEKERDHPTFQEARKIPFPSQAVVRHRDGVDDEYVEFTADVWQWLAGKLEAAPRYGEYDALFRYDLRHSIAAIEYSALATDKLGITRLEEHVRRESHNMMMYPYSDIDLMYGVELSASDVALVREAVWHAQLMARIGNWLSTWERELREQDYSSGVVIYALQRDVVSPEDLKRIERGDDTAHEHVVRRIREKGIEEYFLNRWRDNYGRLAEVNRQLTTVDIEPYVEGMREVLRYHLASRGMK